MIGIVHCSPASVIPTSADPTGALAASATGYALTSASGSGPTTTVRITPAGSSGDDSAVTDAPSADPSRSAALTVSAGDMLGSERIVTSRPRGAR